MIQCGKKFKKKRRIILMDNNINENIENRHISIILSSDENSKKIEIQDNAGGIPEHVIADIFKANVTTKAEGKGTGIGLYMSSQIASKHNGILSVINKNGGACFIFEQNGIGSIL
jgi:signal transduction histidine kinase